MPHEKNGNIVFELRAKLISLNQAYVTGVTDLLNQSTGKFEGLPDPHEREKLSQLCSIMEREAGRGLKIQNALNDTPRYEFHKR